MGENCVLLPLFFITLKIKNPSILITKVTPGPHAGFMGQSSGSKHRNQGLKTGFTLTKVGYSRVLSCWMRMSWIFFQTLFTYFW